MRGDGNTRTDIVQAGAPKTDWGTDPDSGAFRTQVTDEVNGESSITRCRCAELRNELQGTLTCGPEQGLALGREGAEEDRAFGRQETVWLRNKQITRRPMRSYTPRRSS